MNASALPALAKSWWDGADCGPALHDALEEAGWPVQWLGADCWLGEIAVAAAVMKLKKEAPWFAYVSQGRDERSWGRCVGRYETQAAAREAAELALRQALRGCEDG